MAVSMMRRRASKMLSFGFWVQVAALKPRVLVMGGLLHSAISTMQWDGPWEGCIHSVDVHFGCRVEDAVVGFVGPFAAGDWVGVHWCERWRGERDGDVAR